MPVLPRPGAHPDHPRFRTGALAWSVRGVAAKRRQLVRLHDPQLRHRHAIALRLRPRHALRPGARFRPNNWVYRAPRRLPSRWRQERIGILAGVRRVRLPRGCSTSTTLERCATPPHLAPNPPGRFHPGGLFDPTLPPTDPVRRQSSPADGVPASNAAAAAADLVNDQTLAASPIEPAAMETAFADRVALDSITTISASTPAAHAAPRSPTPNGPTAARPSSLSRPSTSARSP